MYYVLCTMNGLCVYIICTFSKTTKMQQIATYIDRVLSLIDNGNDEDDDNKDDEKTDDALITSLYFPIPTNLMNDPYAHIINIM